MQTTTNQETMLVSYFKVEEKTKSISRKLLTAAVQRAAKILQLEKQGIGIDNNISSHSLCAGEAMALHLTGVDVKTIKKNGPIVQRHVSHVHTWTNILFLKGIIIKNGTEHPVPQLSISVNAVHPNGLQHTIIGFQQTKL